MPWTPEGSVRAARQQGRCPECGRIMRASNIARHLAAGHVVLPASAIARLRRGWAAFLRDDGSAGFDSLAEAIRDVCGQAGSR